MKNNWFHIALLTGFILVFSASKLQAAPMSYEQVLDQRTKPVGQVNVSGASASAAATPTMLSGKDRYAASCGFCHDSGAAGAPKIGAKAAWAPRIAKGQDTLVRNAINGIGAMPAKGMCPSCSDEEIKGAVEYLINQSK